MTMLLPILSAFFGIIAFLPVNFYPAAFIFIVPLFLFFVLEEKLWRLIVGALLFRLFFFIGTIYFTLEPFFWISSLLTFSCLPITIWFAKKIFVRFFPDISCSYLLLVSLPFVWTFFDHLIAYYSLLPTYSITAGNAIGSSSFVGLSSYGGLIFLSFFVTVVNALITAVMLQRGNYKNVAYLIIGTVLVLFSANSFSDFELRKNSHIYDNLPNSFSVAIVSVSNAFTVDSFPELVLELRKQKIDLIVFPENIFNQKTDSAMFQKIANELDTNILAAYDTFRNGNKYNSSILFDREGNVVDLHDKNRLTFIGEYWPFGDWQPTIYKWISDNDPKIKSYAVFDRKNADTPGERNLLSVKTKEKEILFAAPICLEIHYPSDLKEYKIAGARFLVNQSSNRWINYGLSNYLYFTDNLKKIASVQLGIPIISSGVDDLASITLPNSKTLYVQDNNVSYKIFFGEIKY